MVERSPVEWKISFPSNKLLRTRERRIFDISNLKTIEIYIYIRIKEKDEFVIINQRA